MSAFFSLFQYPVRKHIEGFRYCQLYLCWICAEVFHAREYKFDMFILLKGDQFSKYLETFWSYFATLWPCFKKLSYSH